MAWQPNPYTVLLLISALAAACVAAFAWRRRSAPGALALVVVMTSLAAWAGTYAIQWASTSLRAQVFWLNATYFGVVVAPTGFLLFTARFTRQDGWITSRALALLAIEPLATFVIVWTNPAHSLYHSSFHLEMSGALARLDWERGPWFWVNVAYSYSLLLAGVILLARNALHSSGPYRQQANLVLVGALIPWAASIYTQAGLSPIPELDLAPVAFTLAGLSFAVGLFRHRLFDLVPVARGVLIENLHDALLVLDRQNRIAEINLAARRLFGLPDSPVYGRPVGEVIPGWETELLPRLREPEGSQELARGEQVFDLTVAALPDRRGRVSGHLVGLHDITARKRAEAKLQASEGRYRLLAENTNDIIWKMDLDGRFSYVSPSVEQLTGFTPEEALARSLPEVVCPGSLPEILAAIQRSVTAARLGVFTPTEYHEVELFCKDGGSVWAEEVARLLLDAEGRPLGFVGVTRDISERKRLQDEHQRALDELTAFNQAMVGRELRMIELKEEVNGLLGMAGRPPKYRIPDE